LGPTADGSYGYEGGRGVEPSTGGDFYWKVTLTAV
jgi:hypothetical protein